MKPVKITAFLNTPIAAFDDWTPSLDNVLIWQLLDQHGMSVAPPTPEIAQQRQQFINDHLPLQLGSIGGEWYHCVSAPHYVYEWRSDRVTHKRWDCQEHHLDWEGRKKTWNSQGFHTKSTVNITPQRYAPVIVWFAIADSVRLQTLLNLTTHLGKMRLGQVRQWQVEDWDDWHLWGADGQLMKPIPIHCLDPMQPIAYRTASWGWRSPSLLPENITNCAMPLNNAINHSHA